MISSVSLVSSSTLPPLLPSMAASTATRGSHQTGRNLIRVLKATLKGPQRGSQRPTSLRPHQGQGLTTSAGDHARFSPETGLPAGRSETSLLNDAGQYAYYGRVAGCLVTGNED